jgi:hypothetical protein
VQFFKTSVGANSCLRASRRKQSKIYVTVARRKLLP